MIVSVSSRKMAKSGLTWFGATFSEPAFSEQTWRATDG